MYRRPLPSEKNWGQFFFWRGGAAGYEYDSAYVITVVKVLLTDPVTKRCRRCRLTISCSDETKKGGKGGRKVANIPPMYRYQFQTASTGRISLKKYSQYNKFPINFILCGVALCSRSRPSPLMVQDRLSAKFFFPRCKIFFVLVLKNFT